MTCDTHQRLAVSVLITDCKLLIGAGVIPDSAVLMLADSIKKVERAFADPPRLVVVGDHDGERFNAIQDAVSDALAEPYFPAPNPSFTSPDRAVTDDGDGK